MHMAPNATALLEWMDIRPSEVGGTLLRHVRPLFRQTWLCVLICPDASIRCRRQFDSREGVHCRRQKPLADCEICQQRQGFDELTWYQEWYLVHRVDLHNKLKSEATSQSRPGVPVQLHLACMVSDVDLINASVTLEDGRIFEGDLLLGADGLHVSADLFR